MLSAVFLAFFGAIVTRTDDTVDRGNGALRRRDMSVEMEEMKKEVCGRFAF